MHSNDYGWSWFARSPGIGIWGGSWDATFSKDGTVYLGPGNGDYIIPSDFMDDGSGRQVVYRSTDGGDTWSKVPLPSGLSGDVKAVYTLPNNSNYVWAGVSGKNKGARILRSTDRGMTWTDVTGPSVGNLGRIFCIVPDASDPTGLTFYVGTQGIYDPENPANGGVYKTTDGVHFTMMSGSPISSVNVSIAVANSSTIYATAYGKGLSKFNGSSWSTVINSPYVYGVAVDPGNTQRVAASTFDFSTMDLYRSDGVMISSDGGASWSNIKAGLQVLSVNPVAFNPDGSGQLVVGVDGGGAFVTDVGNSTPFSGSPASIPGTIQAENFDNGGADVAYHASGGAPSRSSVTGLVAHDWIKYRVAVTAGTYDITVHGSGGTVHLEMNGVNITGPQSLNGDTTITGVDLSGGTQYLKLYVESGNVSVDSVRFDQR
jgi:photosystem II stability/assembly factor-like uncharacterized protein